MSTYNLCFEQKYEKYQNFYQKNFQFLVVKIYLNRRVLIIREISLPSLFYVGQTSSCEATQSAWPTFSP